MARHLLTAEWSASQGRVRASDGDPLCRDCSVFGGVVHATRPKVRFPRLSGPVLASVLVIVDGVLVRDMDGALFASPTFECTHGLARCVALTLFVPRRTRPVNITAAHEHGQGKWQRQKSRQVKRSKAGNAHPKHVNGQTTVRSSVAPACGIGAARCTTSSRD